MKNKLLLLILLTYSLNITSQVKYICVNPLKDWTDSANLILQQNKDLKISIGNLDDTITALKVKLANNVNPATIIYYLSPSGNDNNSGSITSPLFSFNGLVSKNPPAGSLIYLRGGTYAYNTNQTITLKGIINDSIVIKNYPGETPIITKSGTGNYGNCLYFYGSSYVHLKGITIQNWTQSTSGEIASPLWVEKTNNCTFDLLNINNNGCGIIVTHASTTNLFLNIDTWDNHDPYTKQTSDNGPYGNADGFGAITDINTTNTVIGCRSFNNSDDGFDVLQSSGMWIFNNCLSFHNGFRPNSQITGGDGWGFKLGIANSTGESGSDPLPAKNTLLRKVTYCIAACNREGGIALNDNTPTVPSCIITNNTTFKNIGAQYTAGFGFADDGVTIQVLENNIALSEMLANNTGDPNEKEDHNSWDAGYTISSSDFLSVDTTGWIWLPRNSDNSLPCNMFLELKQNSSLYAGGINGTQMGAVFCTTIIPPVNTICKTSYITSGANSMLCDSLNYTGSISGTSSVIYQTSGSLDMENSVFANNDANDYYLMNITGASSTTSVKILNNIIRFNNPTGYGIVIGTDPHISNNQYYSGSQFIGNSITGASNLLGNSTPSSTECLMLGDNSGGVWNNNFFTNCPYALPTKGYGFNNSSGNISYNCFKNCFKSITVKGINNTQIYNNTFYANSSSANDYYTFIYINVTDDGNYASTGTIIKNNVFYNSSAHQANMITVDQRCLSGLVCDYNVYYDTNNDSITGGPAFQIVANNGTNGTESSATSYTFRAWQKMGFDTHSIVLNPNLNSTTLVPSIALNYGSNLGTSFNKGISPSNIWNRNSTLTVSQPTNWECGAYIK